MNHRNRNAMSGPSARARYVALKPEIKRLTLIVCGNRRRPHGAHP